MACAIEVPHRPHAHSSIGTCVPLRAVSALNAFSTKILTCRSPDHCHAMLPPRLTFQSDPMYNCKIFVKARHSAQVAW